MWASQWCRRNMAMHPAGLADQLSGRSEALLTPMVGRVPDIAVTSMSWMPMVSLMCPNTFRDDLGHRQHYLRINRSVCPSRRNLRVLDKNVGPSNRHLRV